MGSVVSGNAAARTGLAWQRSSLAYVVVGLAMVKGLGYTGVRAHPLAGLLPLHWHCDCSRAPGGPGGARRPGKPLKPAGPLDVIAVAVATVIVGVVSIVIVLVDT